MMRVLMTGASGFIGGAAIEALRGRFEIEVVQRRGGAWPGVRSHVVAPWTAAAIVDSIGGPIDAVLHLAAAGTRPEARAPEALIAGNVGLGLPLLEAAKSLGAGRFIYTGSWSELPSLRAALDGRTGAVSTYGAAKAGATMMWMAAADAAGIPALNLRLHNVYGPGEAPHRLLPTLLAAHRAGERPRLSRGEQARDFVYVEDLASAFEAALKEDWTKANPRVLELCTGRATRVREIVSWLAGRLGAPELAEGLGTGPERPDEPAHVVGDPEPARRLLGWQAETSLESGLEATLRAAGFGEGEGTGVA